MAIATKGFTAVMAQRREPPDALDYFPTPPWARGRCSACAAGARYRGDRLGYGSLHVAKAIWQR